MTTALKEIETLTVSERILIVEDLWDGIARSKAELPVHDWQKKELSRRKRNFRKNSNAVMTWQQVKKSILVANA
jgi:putative addiction module component (TIGR02574 family)